MPYSEFAKIINESDNIVFFGGAGVSTESGIPDFRGNNGLYNEKNDNEISPEEMLHIRYFMTFPEKFYMYYKSHMIYPNAKPNKAHEVLCKLEREGKLKAVITQNIDGLHQLAGSQNVIELHGSTLRNYCVKCGKRFELDAVLNSKLVPICDKCGGIVRPDIVFYGEPLDDSVWTKAEMAIEKADTLIVAGTSLTVYPAAGLINIFRGKNLVIINKTPTPYDRYANLVLRDPVGKVFESVLS